MAACDDGVVARPTEVDLFGLAIGTEHLGGLAGGWVGIAGVPIAAVAKRGPELLRDGVDDLEAAVAARCHRPGLGEGAEGDAEALQLCGGGDPVVIDEEDA